MTSEQIVEVAIPKEFTPLPDSSTLVLAIGVEFGSFITNLVIEPTKKNGCVKILAVG